MIIIYYVFAAIILSVQALVLVEAWRHLIYTIRKYRPKPPKYQPPVALIAPCKGIDTTFDRNIESFFAQDYPDYELFFVVQSVDDPAHERLQSIIQRHAQAHHPVRAHLLVAGAATTSSQKLHNTLYAYAQTPDRLKVLAFVDSDACLKPHFLTSMVHPLRRRDVGASTGYRWFVPADTRLSSRVLSAINAFFASCLGPHNWNSTWGGAMAIRRDVFERVGVPQLWHNACTDDYTLTYLVKKAQMLIIFVPACFVASYESLSWAELFSFARRQFIITRIYRPQLWYLALLGLSHFLLAFWLGLAVTLYLFAAGSPHAPYAALLPGTLWGLSFLKALSRQIMIRKILPEDRKPLFIPALLDLFLQPFLALFSLACVLASVGTRTITWRGIRYRLHSIEHTEITPLSPPS